MPGAITMSERVPETIQKATTNDKLKGPFIAAGFNKVHHGIILYTFTEL